MGLPIFWALIECCLNQVPDRKMLCVEFLVEGVIFIKTITDTVTKTILQCNFYF